MKKKQFYDKAMAERYLKHSVVQVDGRAVYIHDIIRSQGRRGFDIVFQDIALGRHGKVNVNSARVDLNPIPVGLMQYCGSTIYLARMPARKWKIGLSIANCQAWNTYPKAVDKKRYGGAHLSSLITSEGFARSARREFVSVKQAKEEASGYVPVPISQRFALTKNSEIVYKNFTETVGAVEEGDDGYIGVFHPRFDFLKQAFQEDVQ